MSVEPAVGTWPALEADYDSIGFSRYASAVENVGRFYMLVRQGSELRLGPELSLDQRLIFRASSSDIEPSFDRPHLVVGPEVQSRLRSMPMPTDAIVDSVVLAFESSFDRRLWSRISLGLADFGLQISDVSQIRGAYIERNNNVILVLADAIVRVDGRVVTINDQIGIY
ncbi:MAG: hypothetical protein HOE73_03195 [Bacteroidetes Order II. Incertae sedis bacterium]|nr:hypothetical protein [Bacteroidetes Order II. bacterium]